MRTPSPRTRPLAGALALTLAVLAGCAAPPAAPKAPAAAMRIEAPDAQAARARLGLLAVGTLGRTTAARAAAAPAITSRTTPASTRDRRHDVFGEVGPGWYSPVDATVYTLPALAGVDAVALGGPDRFVLYADGPNLGIFDVVSGIARILPTIDATRIFDFDVDAFGNVTYVDDLGRVHVFDTRTNQDFVVPVAGRGVGWIDQVAIAPNGASIAVSGVTNGIPEVIVTDLVGGGQLGYPILDPYVVTPGGFELSADGRSLLFDDAGRVRALDTATGFVDNLAGINETIGLANVLGPLASAPVVNATFLAGSPGQIVFERAGQVMTYDRGSNVVDTMPLANQPFLASAGVLRARDELYAGRLATQGVRRSNWR